MASTAVNPTVGLMRHNMNTLEKNLFVLFKSMTMSAPPASLPEIFERLTMQLGDIPGNRVGLQI